MMKRESFEDGRQNLLATQVGWPAFKRARRLKTNRQQLTATTSTISDHDHDGTGKTKFSGKEETVRVGSLQRPHADFEALESISIFSCDNSNMYQPSGHHSSSRAETSSLRLEDGHSCRTTRKMNKTTTTTAAAITTPANIRRTGVWSTPVTLRNVLISCILFIQLSDLFNGGGHFNLKQQLTPQHHGTWHASSFLGAVQGSLIIGDSAIEIQEVDDNNHNNNQAPQNDQQQQQQQLSSQPTHQHQEISSGPEAQFERSNVVLGTSGGGNPSLSQLPTVGQDAFGSTQFDGAVDSSSNNNNNSEQPKRAGSLEMSRLPSGPLPPLSKQTEDITDGDRKSRGNHDFDVNELGTGGESDKGALSGVLLATRQPPNEEDGSSTSPTDKTITGKVVDFELESAGGHNKAKIKKKMKKKKKAGEEMFKKWNKKKKMEKKAMEKKEKKHMKKKKEEGKKDKKKWGLQEHGQKKKGNFKKKKWGKKVKKGKGVKKGKKGKKFLKDKGHKHSGFKNIYHKEEYGTSKKWHDIKREKKWDEASKKWKKKWNKEKGKKYKGDHMKKFEKNKKEGKKYKKAKKEKYKKFKKEQFEKGKKQKMEEHKKKKEGGVKKEEKKMEKKKKKKKP